MNRSLEGLSLRVVGLLTATLVVGLSGGSLAAAEDTNPSQPQDVFQAVPGPVEVLTVEKFVETTGPCDGFCSQCGPFCIAGFVNCALEHDACAFAGWECGPASGHDGCVCKCHLAASDLE